MIRRNEYLKNLLRISMLCRGYRIANKEVFSSVYSGILAKQVKFRTGCLVHSYLTIK